MINIFRFYRKLIVTLVLIYFVWTYREEIFIDETYWLVAKDFFVYALLTSLPLGLLFIKRKKVKESD